jgi:hypothetical protein
MPLGRGEVRGYDFNRMIVEFTMLNREKDDTVRDQYRSDGRS